MGAPPFGGLNMILKLKRTPGIYLVGFMGCGKSTVGRHISKHLGWRFADLDEDIEGREQMSIPEIFDKKGETEFRRIEAEMLNRRVHEIAKGVPWVLALGGGCFAQADNQELIQNHGVAIWLDCPLEMVRSRIAHSTHRPLARNPEALDRLYSERRSAYEKADYRIEIGEGGSPAAAEEILALAIF
jgi:shikimate kinase